MEQFNNNDKSQDILEEEIPENESKEIKTDQDPGLGGILTEDEVFKTRKHLSELIDKVSRIRREINNDKESKDNANKEDKIKKIKEEINEII